MKQSRRIPLLVKVIYTFCVAAAVCNYELAYGAQNFLWFCDVELIATTAALWLESPLLASMMAVAAVLPETGWGIAFFWQLLAGSHSSGVTGYMFERSIPLFTRAISLFHLVLPGVLLWVVHRIGYDRRAWLMQTVVCWAVYVATFWLTDPRKNINWAFGLGAPQHVVAPVIYLLGAMVVVPVGIYLPTHWVLRRLFWDAGKGGSESRAGVES